MPIEIHGRAYKTVAERVAEFRAKYPASDGWSIITDVRMPDESKIIARCEISKDGATVATGHAHERWDSGKAIDASSGYEIAETSAVGRALAFFGLSTDEEIASADEVARAQQQQEVEYERQCQHMETVREDYSSIAAIKDFLSVENWSAALECWSEIGREAQTALWRAPSKGGIFTTEERRLIQELRSLVAKGDV